ncbi:hypothetical protein [Streptomyces sp. NBC_00096]|uniref:hypothetical protein n=1 Tax=Streptomyces sp. NBC_00096 TaxID=2975650 RepID=UPI0032472544
MTTWRIGTTTIHKALEAQVPALPTEALRTDDTALLKRYAWPAPGFSNQVCEGVSLQAAPRHTPGGDGTVRFVADGQR